MVAAALKWGSEEGSGWSRREGEIISRRVGVQDLEVRTRKVFRWSATGGRRSCLLGPGEGAVSTHGTGQLGVLWLSFHSW